MKVICNINTLPWPTTIKTTTQRFTNMLKEGTRAKYVFNCFQIKVTENAFTRSQNSTVLQGFPCEDFVVDTNRDEVFNLELNVGIP